MGPPTGEVSAPSARSPGSGCVGRPSGSRRHAPARATTTARRRAACERECCRKIPISQLQTCTTRPQTLSRSAGRAPFAASRHVDAVALAAALVGDFGGRRVVRARQDRGRAPLDDVADDGQLRVGEARARRRHARRRRRAEPPNLFHRGARPPRAARAGDARRRPRRGRLRARRAGRRARPRGRSPRPTASRCGRCCRSSRRRRSRARPACAAAGRRRGRRRPPRPRRRRRRRGRCRRRRGSPGGDAGPASVEGAGGERGRRRAGSISVRQLESWPSNAYGLSISLTERLQLRPGRPGDVDGRNSGRRTRSHKTRGLRSSRRGAHDPHRRSCSPRVLGLVLHPTALQHGLGSAL